MTDTDLAEEEMIDMEDLAEEEMTDIQVLEEGEMIDTVEEEEEEVLTVMIPGGILLLPEGMEVEEEIEVEGLILIRIRDILIVLSRVRFLSR
jgi:hypothetical protein